MKLEVEGEEVGGQILPHFYCEDMMNVMNKVMMMVLMMRMMRMMLMMMRSKGRRIIVIVTATYFSGEAEGGLVKVCWDHKGLSTKKFVNKNICKEKCMTKIYQKYMSINFLPKNTYHKVYIYVTKKYGKINTYILHKTNCRRT